MNERKQAATVQDRDELSTQSELQPQPRHVQPKRLLALWEMLIFLNLSFRHYYYVN
ncbi:hypothetical protein KQI74_07295 [Paenibacillus barcinonensis]|uniref:hypothetical protein n=1 Tax=Paenibacillus TaxID=44249 RepID=UPI001C1128DC|nr:MULTISPECIES: hypothetical protein [Paenibacillus]MBU5352079.1 hypothetical protein [Paenibacillus barcinonensis]MDM5277284.1 hypothetical protein [Paenibacillus silvae]